MKSVIKLAEGVREEIPDELDMKVEQMDEIMYEYENSLRDMVYCAFQFGYLQGTRRKKDEK